MLSERLALLVSMDGNQAVRGFEQIGHAADKNLSKAEGRMTRFGNGMVKVGTGMAAVGLVAVAGLMKAAKASELAEQSTRKLSNSIENNDRLTGHSVKEFTDLAQAIQAKTAADGDDITAGIAVLAQGELHAKQIKELTPLVVDLARKRGVDEVTAFTMVKKATEGSTGALKKAGIVVDENKAKTDAYGATIDALRGSVGGFAEEEGKTFSGSLERLKNQLGDIEEGVGKGAVDAFTSLLKPVAGVTNEIGKANPETEALVGKVATFGSVTAIAAGGLAVLTGKAIAARQAMTPLQGSIAGVTAALGLGFTAWSLYESMMAKAKETGSHAADGLAGLFERADPATVTMAQLNREMTNLNVQIGDTNDAIANSEAPWDADKRAEMGAAADAAQRVHDQWMKLKNAALDLAASHHITADAALQQILADDDLTTSITGGTAAVSDQTVAIQTNVQALKDRQNQLHALVDPQFAMLDALEKEKGARIGLAMVMKDKNHSAAAEQEAQENLTKAVAATDAAAMTLTQSMLENGQTMDDVRAILDQWVASGRITADTAKDIAKQLAFATGTAEKYAKDYTASVGIDGIKEASRLLDGLISKFGEIEGSHRYAVKVDPVYDAQGGMVYAASGFTPRGTDTVPAMLTPGEGVVNRRGMSVLGATGLNALNHGSAPAPAGGAVINIYGPVTRRTIGDIVYAHQCIQAAVGGR